MRQQINLPVGLGAPVTTTLGTNAAMIYVQQYPETVITSRAENVAKATA
jgi:hypothetical protein